MDVQKHWVNLQDLVANFAPKLIAAVAILIVAWVIGMLLSRAAKYLISKSGFGDNQTARADMGVAIGKALFWVTMLIATPAILGSLGLQSLMQPMQAMAHKFLSFIPNLVAAGLIFGIGFAVATVARQALTSVLEAAKADEWTEAAGLKSVTGSTGISRFVGTLVFALIIVPIAIAALDALGVEAISTPAKQMLQSFLDAIPKIFAASIVALLSYTIARFASDTLSSLLPTVGSDLVGKRLGLTDEVLGGTSMSRVAGMLAFAAIMIFGLVEATKLLDFEIVSTMLSQILALGGRILLGSVIIGFGVIAADFISSAVAKSKDAKVIATPLKIAIIVLASAMGLRQMGVANEIITTGFTALIGALAVGSAIAIGWGGKDTASRLLDKWTRNL
ncbi:MAG: mechanosensitive ion channel [Alphaproteobacteria bacterium]|nr:mechanosensitive ion channel [Alphaproteobacteria bacterium]